MRMRFAIVLLLLTYCQILYDTSAWLGKCLLPCSSIVIQYGLPQSWKTVYALMISSGSKEANNCSRYSIIQSGNLQPLSIWPVLKNEINSKMCSLTETPCSYTD